MTYDLDRVLTDGALRVTTDDGQRIIIGTAEGATILINIFGDLLAAQAALTGGDSAPKGLLPWRHK